MSPGCTGVRRGQSDTPGLGNGQFVFITKDSIPLRPTNSYIGVENILISGPLEGIDRRLRSRQAYTTRL